MAFGITYKMIVDEIRRLDPLSNIHQLYSNAAQKNALVNTLAGELYNLPFSNELYFEDSGTGILYCEFQGTNIDPLHVETIFRNQFGPNSVTIQQNGVLSIDINTGNINLPGTFIGDFNKIRILNADLNNVQTFNSIKI